MVRFINQKTAIKSPFDRTLYILYKFYTFTHPPPNYSLDYLNL